MLRREISNSWWRWKIPPTTFLLWPGWVKEIIWQLAQVLQKCRYANHLPHAYWLIMFLQLFYQIYFWYLSMQLAYIQIWFESIINNHILLNIIIFDFISVSFGMCQRWRNWEAWEVMQVVSGLCRGMHTFCLGILLMHFLKMIYECSPLTYFKITVFLGYLVKFCIFKTILLVG